MLDPSGASDALDPAASSTAYVIGEPVVNVSFALGAPQAASLESTTQGI